MRLFFVQLRNELWKLFGKKRTYIGTGMFLLLQTVGILLFRFARGPYHDIVRDLSRIGLSPEKYLTNWTIASFIVVPMALFMMPLYVALVGGDLVAKEAEDGALRMMLARPVSRLRLLVLKWIAGAIFAVALILTLGVFAPLLARAFFPGGGMFVEMPDDQMLMQSALNVFDSPASWERYAAAHLVMTAAAVTIMTLAFMFSCFNVKPAAATVLAISFFFISMILHDLPYFRDMRPWFFVHQLNVWMGFFRQQIPFWKVGESLSILAGYNLAFFVIGYAVFAARDIKS